MSISNFPTGGCFISFFHPPERSYQQKNVIPMNTGLSTNIKTKGGPIPLFSDTFDTKYRAENFTDTDSDTDTNTNAYRHMVAIISHLLLYKYIDKAFK